MDGHLRRRRTCPGPAWSRPFPARARGGISIQTPSFPPLSPKVRIPVESGEGAAEARSGFGPPFGPHVRAGEGFFSSEEMGDRTAVPAQGLELWPVTSPKPRVPSSPRPEAAPPAAPSAGQRHQEPGSAGACPPLCPPPPPPPGVRQVPPPVPLGPQAPSPRYPRARVQPRSPSTSRRSPKPARTAPARPRGGLSLVLSSVNMGPAHTPLAGRRAALVASGERAPPPRPTRPRARAGPRARRVCAARHLPLSPECRARSGSLEVCRRRAGPRL